MHGNMSRIHRPPGRQSSDAPTAALVRSFFSVVLVWAGYLTVTAGFFRGTVFGRIQSTDILFGTRYGVVWLAAFAVGVFAKNK